MHFIPSRAVLINLLLAGIFIMETNQEEIWKDIPGYKGKYQVSNTGKIKTNQEFIKAFYSKKRMKSNILKQSNRLGYMVVSLNDGNKAKQYSVHRIIAFAFIENPENKPFINHKNGNKSDNRLDNLEWVTAKENSIHSVRVLKNNFNKKGSKNPQSKTIYQYNKMGGLVRIWGSIREAARNGYVQSGITFCLKEPYRTHKGYLWRYERIENFKIDFKIGMDRKRKRINKLDKFGNIIKKYNSMVSAKIDGYNTTNILRSIKYNKLYKNYYWSYD